MARRHYLSFDVGIRNLAYCWLSVDPELSLRHADAVQIHDWSIIDLDKVSSIETCCKRLVKVLHDKFAESANFKTDSKLHVFIERQPRGRSAIMMAIQMFICCFFEYQNCVSQDCHNKIQFVNAGKKLSLVKFFRDELGMKQEEVDTVPKNQVETVPKNTKKAAKAKLQRIKYTDNKRVAVQMCKFYLENVSQDYANLALLDAYPKKDDLCDAFLQAFAIVLETKK